MNATESAQSVSPSHASVGATVSKKRSLSPNASVDEMMPQKRRSLSPTEATVPGCSPHLGAAPLNSENNEKRQKPKDEIQAEHLFDLLRNQMFAAERQLQRAINASSAGGGMDVDVWVKRNKDAAAVESVFESTRERFERLFPFNRRFFSAARQREELEKEVERKRQENEAAQLSKAASKRAAVQAVDTTRLAMIAENALKAQLPRMVLGTTFDFNPRVFVSTRHFFSEFEKLLKANGFDAVKDHARFLPCCLTVPQTTLYNHICQIYRLRQEKQKEEQANKPDQAKIATTVDVVTSTICVTMYQFVKQKFYMEFDMPWNSKLNPRLDQIMDKMKELKQKRRSLDKHCRAFVFLLRLAIMHDYTPLESDGEDSLEWIFLRTLNKFYFKRLRPVFVMHKYDGPMDFIENFVVSTGEMETCYKTPRNIANKKIIAQWYHMNEVLNND